MSGIQIPTIMKEKLLRLNVRLSTFLFVFLRTIFMAKDFQAPNLEALITSNGPPQEIWPKEQTLGFPGVEGEGGGEDLKRSLKGHPFFLWGSSPSLPSSGYEGHP